MDLLVLGATMGLALAGMAVVAGSRNLKPVRVRTRDRRRVRR